MKLQPIHVEHDGKLYGSLLELADSFGINHRTLVNRYSRGDRGERLIRETRIRPRRVPWLEKVCPHCNSPFKTKVRKQRYCTHRCSAQAYGITRRKPNPKQQRRVIRPLTQAEIWEVKCAVTRVIEGKNKPIRLDVPA